MKQLFLDIARRIMVCPTAPYHEQAVAAEIHALCAEYGLRCCQDAVGNLLVELNTKDQARPMVFAAHMDHPGFDIVRRKSPTQLQARFLGGVGDSYFKKGTSIRLYPGGFPARLAEFKVRGKTKECVISTDCSLNDPVAYGTWDFPGFQLKGDKILSRGCDDLIGVSAALSAVIHLKRSRARVNVLCVFTRAEEVGFHGALVVAAEKALPEDALVLSLETSRELPPVKMGKGVIIRVGDKASVFNSAATRFLGEVAGLAQKKKKDFQFQRALMGGGTCEATAYQEYGYESAALCVALGNYHNCGKKDVIAPEYVSLSDSLAMVELLCASARHIHDYKRLSERLNKRLEVLLIEARRQFQNREA